MLDDMTSMEFALFGLAALIVAALILAPLGRAFGIWCATVYINWRNRE